MRKRILTGIVPVLLALVFLASCGSGAAETAEPAESAEPGYTLEQKTVPMRIQTSVRNEISDAEMNLYFVNGGDIPYVALSEYMPFVGSIYKDDQLSIPAAEYEIERIADDHILVKRTDNDSFMDIEPKKDVIEFVGMDWFIATPGSTSLLSILSVGESGRGGSANLFRDNGKSYERTGEAIIRFDFSEYDIDLIDQDGECYLPLQTVNDLLVSGNYVLVVYNGEKLIASSMSSDLIDEMYEAPTGTMSEDFARFNYNELRFLLDTFYGLKPEHDIDSFGDYFGSTGLLADLSGTDAKAFDRALRRLTMKYFDDGHSGLLKFSYLSGVPDPNDIDEKLAVFSDLGISNNDKAFPTIQRQIRRANYYPDHPEIDPFEGAEKPWFYEEVGDTAIITFDAFAINRTDYYTQADLEDPQDTIELIAYAHSQITRDNSPIKNVVLDLSCNGGGDADAAIFTIAWFKNTGRITLRDTLTGAQAVCDYEADINLDGEFDMDDWLPDDVNKYCLISGASFSCGNLVPAAFKDAADTTLLGLTSGGGTCAIRPCTTASGAVFTISGTRQISTVRNGSFYNIDLGVEPDFVLSKMESFYDREQLAELIHTLP